MALPSYCNEGLILCGGTDWTATPEVFRGISGNPNSIFRHIPSLKRGELFAFMKQLNICCKLFVRLDAASEMGRKFSKKNAVER